jgi:glycosyltransferase involved in cell wall biosynthesis
MNRFAQYVILACVFLVSPHCVFSLAPLKNYKSSDPNRKTICLNMIVKNESSVIRRCIDSAVPIIDYWVIVDTGSSDGTQQIIQDHMRERGVPGELHERPWKNFCHNRNEALELARGKADFVFFLDADEFISYNDGFQLPVLDKDCYYMNLRYGSFKWGRILLANNHLDWKWVGVLHEVLQIPPKAVSGNINDAHVVCTTEGARSKDPQKYQKDAQILEEGLKEEPNNSRYVFYLAQSYENAQDNKKALENYQKRVAMGGWDQEVFIAQMRIGGIQERLGADADTIIGSYKKAIETRRSRAEPYYHMANYYRRMGECEKGYRIAKIGATIPTSTDVLFVDEWMYDWGILLELSICAYWIEKYKESQEVSLKLLSKPNLPDNVRECVENNLGFANQKLLETSSLSNESSSLSKK